MPWLLRRGAVALALCATAGLACAGGDRDPQTDSGEAAAPADSAPAAAPGTPQAGMPAASGEDTAGVAGAWVATPVASRRPDARVATLVDVRTATHAGYDRIVLDFGADPVPSYRIEALDGTAAHCGSGEPVDPAGGPQLEIALEPAMAHTEEGAATVRERDRRFDAPAVARLVLSCDFEANVAWVALLRAHAPVRVLELGAPYRLVIDVAHPRNGQTQRLP